jgi:hypothetical protein
MNLSAQAIWRGGRETDKKRTEKEENVKEE